AFVIFQALLKEANEVDRDKEHCWVLGLDTNSRIKYAELVSLGTLSSSLVHPREVFRMAIMKAVASIIIGHNHPSGEVIPSQDDISITKRLAEAGRIIGIKLLDHVIISENTYVSMMERGDI
ncbi:MAG: JAB domain-containing protein, partial [Nitrospirota bacterium]|nr:JAB domain-containing protein [Nitrospirota bacterium]